MEDTWCIYTLADGFLIVPVQHVLSLAIMICLWLPARPIASHTVLAVLLLLAASSWYFWRA